MADKVVLGLEVPSQVINSYKDLKQAIKSAQDEQVKMGERFGTSSAEFKKATQSVSNLKDKVEDLNDSSRSLKGSGIERSAQGFSQLGEGLRTLDLDKVKVGLNAIKSALAATGIMLLVQGVTYLIQNFEELSKGSGILGTVLRAIGEIIKTVKEGFDQLTDSINLTNTALDKFGEAIVKNSSVMHEKLNEITHSLDNQAKVAKASGQSTIEIEKQKQDAIIFTNEIILKQIEAFVRAGGVLDEEKKKLFNASIQFIKDANTEKKVIEINHNKEINTEFKKHLEEKAADKKKKDEEFETALKKQRELIASFNKEDEETAAKKAEAEEAAVLLQMENTLRVSEYNKQKAQEDADFKIEQDKKHRDAVETNINASLEVAKISFESQAQLTNFLFDLKRSRGIKGSAEDLKLAKRQFQVNKALAIQSSIISGIQGVVNALSAQSVIPEPFGTILKVATAVGIGIAATVNTAKIASQQFNEGGGGGGGDSSAAVGVGSAAAAAPPTINTPANTPPSTTQFDNTGKNLSTPLKAQVVETELTSTQRGVQRFQEQATF